MNVNEFESRPPGFRRHSLPIPAADHRALEQYFLSDHIEIFWDASTRYNVFILVRRINPRSLYYVGLLGYTPKCVDCKAKTAPGDWVHPTLGAKQTAGLVVNPELDGMRNVFGAKYEDAVKCWSKTKPHVAEDERFVSMDKPFCVQGDERHKHYGCLMYSTSGIAADCKYIHGDYDLYGLVNAARPRPNEPSQSRTELGTVQKYGPVYEGLRMHLNRHFGTPMIQHGSQDTYTGFTNERIDIFMPNGEVKVGVDEAQTREFYRTWLNLRLPHGAREH